MYITVPGIPGRLWKRLRRNDLAKESVLYIFSDGPKKNADQEDLNKIQEVRNLIREEKWCGEVKIIERDENLGISKICN